MLELVENEIPQSIEEIIAGLKSFGVVDFEEILTIKVGDKKINLKLTNIPTDADIEAQLAVEDCKGYSWTKKVKCELLSRSISYLDGLNLSSLDPQQRIVADPTRFGIKADIQVVLRNLLLGWGQEVTDILWKVLMTHSQRVEDSLIEQFPEAALLTETEKRFMERAQKEIEEQESRIVRESLEDLYQDEGILKTE